MKQVSNPWLLSLSVRLIEAPNSPSPQKSIGRLRRRWSALPHQENWRSWRAPRTSEFNHIIPIPHGANVGARGSSTNPLAKKTRKAWRKDILADYRWIIILLRGYASDLIFVKHILLAERRTQNALTSDLHQSVSALSAIRVVWHSSYASHMSIRAWGHLLRTSRALNDIARRVLPWSPFESSGKEESRVIWYSAAEKTQ